MARWKKTSVDIKAKVIEDKINNPNKSSRDIANEMNWVISHDSVCDIINNDLPQVATESNATAELVDRNNKLQSMADALIQEMIEQKHQSVTLAQLTSVRESTFRQNQLIQGKNTENIGISGYDLLQEIKSGKITKESAYETMAKMKSGT